MNRYRKLLSRRPNLVLAVMVFFTLFFSWQLLSLKIDSSNESMLPRNDPAYGYLQEFRRLYGEDEFIVVAFRTGGKDAAQRMAQIEKIAVRIRNLPHIQKVQSPLRPSGGEVRSLGPAEARLLLSENPAYTGILASKDMRNFALLAWIAQMSGNQDYRSRIVRGVRRIAAEGRIDGLEIYVAGTPVEKNDIATYVRNDQALIVPIIFALFAAIIFGVYRNAAVTILAMGLVGAGLIWTLGFYAWMGWELNTVTGLLSPLIMIVTLENAIHFLNHYASQMARGSAPITAMDSTLEAVLVPCSLSAITTAGGLLTIATLGVPAVQVFGFFAAAGVFFSFVLSMSAFPVLIHFAVRDGSHLSPKPCPSFIRRGLEKTSVLTARRPRAVIYAAVILTAISFVGISRLIVDTDIIRALRPSAPLRRATDFIDREMGGVNSLEIIVSQKEKKSLLAARPLNQVARLQDFMEKQPEITKTISVVDTLSYALQGTRNHRPRSVPADDGQLRLIGEMARNSPASQKRFRPWANEAFTQLRISARMSAIGSQAAARLYRRIEAFAQENFGDALRLKMTGNLLLLSNMSNNLVSRQIQSLIIATIFVLLTIGFLFRSVRIMFLSAVPNIIPICIVFGLMGWLGIPLSVPTAMISSISLGLVVDNTIHFLYSFQKLRRDGKEWSEAIGMTIQNTGRPISISAFVLMGGFWAGIIGSFLPVMYFSVFMGLTILIAVLCDLLLLPSMLHSMRFAWEKKNAS